MIIKKFENFSQEEEYDGLNSSQEEELFEIFNEWVDRKYPDLSKEELIEQFLPGSDGFVDFLRELEEETEWFDYTQIDKIYQEISIYINDLYEEDDTEWDDTEEDEEDE
jgi:hypothetical protein